MGGVRKNPIWKLVDDETFIRLYDLGLLDEIAVRNVAIKQEFARLRRERNSTEAIAVLARQEFRSFSRVRQIVFTPSPLDELVPGKNGGANRKKQRRGNR